MKDLTMLARSLLLVIVLHTSEGKTPLQRDLSFDFNDSILPVNTINQPELCSLNVHWNPNGSILIDLTSSIQNSSVFFIDSFNQLYIDGLGSNRVSISSTLTGLIHASIPWNHSRRPASLFVYFSREIFIAYPQSIDRLNQSTVQSTIELNGTCSTLFVDRTRTLYCSLTEQHRVITFSLDRPPQIGDYSLGDGSCGSTTRQLCFPLGIHVTSLLDVYVADTNNDRIQLFKNRSVEGTTVLGGNSNVITSLSKPTAVIADYDGRLFIVDRDNHRIIHYFRSRWTCLIGCAGRSGSASSELSFPTDLAFDYEGNLFVLDRGNRRIQKYQLERNTCCK